MPEKMKYDSAWKDIIEELFPEFLEFYFPEIYKDIDFKLGYSFLNKELKKIVKDNQIGKRFADELVKVFLKDGSEKWILIHIEVQGTAEIQLEKRIFVYHYRIFDKYEKESVSLVLLTDKNPHYRPDSYQFQKWNFDLCMKYPVIKFLDYQKETNRLLESKNPFALVTLIQLKSMEAIENNQKYNAKMNLILHLFRKGFSKEKIEKILFFIDWVLQLPEELEIKLENEINELNEEAPMAYITNWERRAKKQGIEEGIQQGIEKGIEKIVEKLYRKGKSVQEIADLTDLSIEKIKPIVFKQ